MDDPIDPLIESMAKAGFESNPAYRDSEGKQLIKFEDIIVSNGPYWRDVMKTAVAALEAAGFRIAHPDNVTDEMLAAAECAGDICPITDRGTIRQTRAAITAALRAAPLHGKG